MDKTQVAKIALGLIGEDDQITSIDEDCNAARKVKAVFDQCRQSFLARHEWKFAKRTLDLSARAEDVNYPLILYSSAFPLPSNMMRFIAVVDPELEAGLYSIENGPNGSEIHIDSDGPITVQLVEDCEDIARFTPLAARALAGELATFVADALGATDRIKAKAEGKRVQWLRDARQENQHAAAPRVRPTSPWIKARLGSRRDIDGHPQ